MKTPSLLSYGFSHHLFHQAVELQDRFDRYAVATPSFFSAATLRRVGRLSRRLAALLARRSHPRLRAEIVHPFPIEHAYQLSARLFRKDYSYYAAHDRMARRIVRRFDPPAAVIAIDTGAESLFRAWAGRSFRVLDLTIANAPFRSHLFRAAESAPDAAGVWFHHPGEWELRRYAAEAELADLVLCPSEFVMESCRFIGVPEYRLRLLPYGFDPGRFHAPPTPPDPAGPLRLVFVGTFCTRKGSHLLLPAFAAVRARTPDAELHVFGDVQDHPAEPPPGVVFHGRIPQPLLAERLRGMHLMAFPTLFEGSSYAVYQALASGVPVVTTRNCGSIVDTTCGVVLAEPAVAELTATLLALVHDRVRLAALAAGAAERVKHYTWARYGERLHRILAEACPALAPFDRLSRPVQRA